MPETITFGDGSTTEYLYDADGRKLRTVHRADGKTTTTDYVGNLIYENGKPVRLLTGYGYVSLPDGMYHYYLKDHQGNNRVVADRNGKVEEVNHYYPFGGMFAHNGNVQPYKYNGKELDTRKELNWYDYGARHYDPAVGRFITSDPLSEKDYSASPYIYCGSNPINRIDKDGKIWETVWDAASLSLGINSFWKNISEGSYGAAAIDGAGVVIDAVAAAIPFIPGGAGAVINSVRATDKISDATKSTNRAGKAIEKSNNNIKIDIAPENKIDRSLLNPPSKPGLAPTFKSDGTPVEIHHINQNPKGPFKEMSRQEHRGKGNYKKNHSNHNKESQIDRSEFNRAKKEYWKNEYEQK